MKRMHGMPLHQFTKRHQTLPCGILYTLIKPTTVPAPTVTFFPMVTGAINDELAPTNVSDSIKVSCLKYPS